MLGEYLLAACCIVTSEMEKIIAKIAAREVATVLKNVVRLLTSR